MEQDNKTDYVGKEAFREGMKLLAGAVTIVASGGKAGKGGITATAVCSVSDSPPTLLVCINRENEMSQMIMENGQFSVNLLPKEMEQLANRFAGFEGVSMEDRFLKGNWEFTENGLPLLPGSIASFACLPSQVVESGSHNVIFGQITQVNYQDGLAPLLYFDRKYSSITKLK